MSPHTCFPCVRSEQRRQEKVTKEKATLHAASLRFATGRPASGRLRGAPQNSLRAGALRSNNCGELDNDAGALRRACSPRNRPDAGRPVAQRRGRRLGVAFLLGTFLWRSKEEVPRPPGRVPASALCRSALQDQRQGFDKLSPNGERGNSATIKTIATSALWTSARAQKHIKLR